MNSNEERTISVTTLTGYIQGLLENTIPHVSVIGEISNYKLHASGHRYFTLKDDQAQIRCVMWKSKNISFKPNDGMKVIVSGRISVYAPQGTYQIDCSSIFQAGVGELYKAYIILKQELQELGYFDESVKKTLPKLPKVIGVSTSGTGAALRDILSTIERRFPLATVIVRPTQVQGSGSEYDIAKAIKDLENQHCDIIIIGRGGGSIEDLWAYNTQTVADAIYFCNTPIISAVGHETDFSISDFVADVRAATPTAAAELCTPVRLQDYLFWLDEYSTNITDIISNRLLVFKEQISEFQSANRFQAIRKELQSYKREIRWCLESIQSSITSSIKTHKSQLSFLQQTIEHLHPHKPLDRGFALLKNKHGYIGTEHKIQTGDQITIITVSQQVEAIIGKTESL